MKKRLVPVVFAIVACGPSPRDHGGDDSKVDAKEPDAYCETSISGKVFAPNGTLPLFNVTVYAPVSDPPPFPAGVQCTRCEASLPGGAYGSATTDATGKFTLTGVPAGANVPIIITTGKWRRKLTVPLVTQCQDTAIPDGTFRLPKNKSEGEMPRIAIVTGGCDALACIFSKLGIDTTEFGSSSTGTTNVVFYNGSGGTAPGTPAASTALHNDLNEMKKFDVVVNSCECDEHRENKVMPDLLRQYADIGGRVLGSHYHYVWSSALIPQWLPAATSWNSGASTAPPDLVDMTHPGGMALATWLQTVGASTTLGQISLGVKTYNASGIGPAAQRWLYASGAAPSTTHYLSWNTPIGQPVENQCGKVVYAGMHVSSGGSVGTNFPASCGASFTPDEKAFAFLLFDLTSCTGQIF